MRESAGSAGERPGVTRYPDCGIWGANNLTGRVLSQAFTGGGGNFLNCRPCEKDNIVIESGGISACARLGIKGGMPMSALSIIVGGWFLLNAVIFAALMLRRDQPAVRDRLFRLVVDGRREAEEGPCSRTANLTDSP